MTFLYKCSPPVPSSHVGLDRKAGGADVEHVFIYGRLEDAGVGCISFFQRLMGAGTESFLFARAVSLWCNVSWLASGK